MPIIEQWIIPLVTLTSLEIVLGIDNIVFITILVGRLPQEKRGSARSVGLFMAMGTRILLLLTLNWIMGLTRPLIELPFHVELTGKDIILLAGGIFLIWKATKEIHYKLEGKVEERLGSGAASFGSIVTQIAIIDIVFSLDSVITAVGMAQEIWVMIAAVVVAVMVMMVAAKAIGEFVERHPTVKMLALSFLLLVGVLLVAEGLGQHVNKGYVYFAMAFSLIVEVLNMRARKSTPAKEAA